MMTEGKMTTNIRADLMNYRNSVLEKHRNRHVSKNERNTEWSLVIPLFRLLGYDVNDPEQCIPQYKDHSMSGPVDFALIGENGKPQILVEVKPASVSRLSYHQKQLARYLKESKVTLGILTSGVEWLFFTKNIATGEMETEPFEEWNLCRDDAMTPSNDIVELMDILRKDSYRPQLVRDFARGKKIFPEDGEDLGLPELFANGKPEQHRCDYCQREFLIVRFKSITTFSLSPRVASRHCSNVCRGQADSSPAPVDWSMGGLEGLEIPKRRSSFECAYPRFPTLVRLIRQRRLAGALVADAAAPNHRTLTRWQQGTQEPTEAQLKAVVDWAAEKLGAQVQAIYYEDDALWDTVLVPTRDLTALRRSLDLSQAVVAATLGVSRDRYRKCENGAGTQELEGRARRYLELLRGAGRR